MRSLRFAGAILTTLSVITAICAQPALAFGPPPPSVPEPSPILGVGAGVVVLGVCLFLRYRAVRRRTIRPDA